MRLTVLTTSYPITPQTSSGIFVARLLQHLPTSVTKTIVTPASRLLDTKNNSPDSMVRTFRYAPRPLEVLAHEPGGIPVTLRTRKWSYLLLPGFLFSMLVSCIRQSRAADIIHANWAICGCVASLAGKLLRVPVVTTLRGDDVTRAQRSAIDRMILLLCLRWSSAVVCVSHSIDAWLHQRYPQYADKTRVIENGVEDVFLSLPLERDGASSGSLRLITVGSLIPRKGIDRILLAMHRLHDFPALSLTVVGEGVEQSRLAQMVEGLGLQQRVHFVGALPPPAIPEQLAKAHVFVLASHSEGRPNAVLEAMAAGLPVVASNIPGVDEIVQHGTTGLLFPPDSTETLVDHVKRLATNAELRSRMGRAGRDAIIKLGLRWQSTGMRYFELYRQLMPSGTKENT